MLWLGSTLILIGFIKLLRDNEYSALFCAALYTLVGIVMRYVLLYPNGANSLLQVSVTTFIVTFVYFWALKKTQSYPIVWWIVLAAGIFIGLI